MTGFGIPPRPPTGFANRVRFFGLRDTEPEYLTKTYYHARQGGRILQRLNLSPRAKHIFETHPLLEPWRRAEREREQQRGIRRLGQGRAWTEPWRIPFGRSDPYPRDITGIPEGSRQAWLRSYYRANPLAAQRARGEAATLIGWARRHLR